MSNCKTTPTLVITSFILSKDDDGSTVDPTMFKRLVVSLMHLTKTRLDVMSGVSLISRFMDSPRKGRIIFVFSLRKTLEQSMSHTSSPIAKSKNQDGSSHQKMVRLSPLISILFVRNIQRLKENYDITRRSSTILQKIKSIYLY